MSMRQRADPRLLTKALPFIRAIERALPDAVLQLSPAGGDHPEVDWARAAQHETVRVPVSGSTVSGGQSPLASRVL